MPFYAVRDHNPRPAYVPRGLLLRRVGSRVVTGPGGDGGRSTSTVVTRAYPVSDDSRPRPWTKPPVSSSHADRASVDPYRKHSTYSRLPSYVETVRVITQTSLGRSSGPTSQ